MTRPPLRRHEVDAIATRVTEALYALGATPSALHVAEAPAGLVFTARIGDRSGACVVIPGMSVTWREVALTLLGDALASLNTFTLPAHERQQHAWQSDIESNKP